MDQFVHVLKMGINGANLYMYFGLLSSNDVVIFNSLWSICGYLIYGSKTIKTHINFVSLSMHNYI